MTQRQGKTPPVMRRAAGLHEPLDRLYLTDTDTLGNLVNGLGQINCNTLPGNSPGHPSELFGSRKCGARRAHYSIRAEAASQLGLIQALNFVATHDPLTSSAG